MKLQLLPLGINGFIPSHGRQTMSFLLLGEDEALLLDAGSGVARLVESEIAGRLASLSRLDVLLTHYHLDHVVGLSYLPGVWRGRPLRLFAPGRPLVDAEPQAALAQLLSPPLFPVTLERWPLPVEVVPVREESLEIGSLHLRLRRQRHPGGSVGVRVGDVLAYCTDTAMDEGTADFVRGVGTLLHEVWLSDEEAAVEDAGRLGHSAAGAVADLARRAAVGRLAPVHHHPRRQQAELESMARGMAERSGLAVELLTEGRPLALES